MGADSKDVPNIIVSSSSLSAIPHAKRKTAPRPEEITAKLNDLVRERNSSEEDPEVAQACDRGRSPEVLEMRKILDKIPQADDIKTGSPFGRRSISPGDVSSPRRQISHSQRNSSSSSSRDKFSPIHKRTSPLLSSGSEQTPRRQSTSPQSSGFSKRGSLRRRLSQKQLVKFIDRRKSSGRSTPDILEELEEENPDNLDFMLDDLWSDDDDDDDKNSVLLGGKSVLQRSFSHSEMSQTPDSAFQTSAGVSRSASMKATFISGSRMASAISLENISEEKPERTASEENLAKAVAATRRGKQKRSSITAEPGLLDNKPNFSDIKELTKVQNQVRTEQS